MRQGVLLKEKFTPKGITIDKKIMRQGIMWKEISRVLLKQYTFGKVFMRQGIMLGHSLCDGL